DIEARLTHRPADAAERALFGRLGRVSEVIDLMGRARFEGASVLASVRAVDTAYPLLGAVEADGDGSLLQQLGPRAGVRGALVDPLLLDRLGMGVGDLVGLGTA